MSTPHIASHLQTVDALLARRARFGTTFSSARAALSSPLLNQKAHVEGKRHRIALATLSNPLKPKKRRNLAGKTNNGAQSTGGNVSAFQPEHMCRVDHERAA